ncbi:MAG: recombinase family protein [Pseudomonadota bacterium]|jgi:site-specific DNA recombinase
MNKAIGYIRVSTQDQATEGVSLETQRAKIAAWCAVNDYELVAVYEDAGISGSKMENRDGLNAALKSAGKGTALVAYSISRLARSTRDMLEIAERLEKRGADLVSLTERIDTSSAAGRMIFQMLAVLAEFERRQIGERTRTALAHKKATGEVYAPTPFGYEAVEGRLREVKAEARIVAEILKRRDAGDTLAEIADDLNARGVPGKRGGRWYPSTVRYLVNRQAA